MNKRHYLTVCNDCSNPTSVQGLLPSHHIPCTSLAQMIDRPDSHQHHSGGACCHNLLKQPAVRNQGAPIVTHGSLYCNNIYGLYREHKVQTRRELEMKVANDFKYSWCLQVVIQLHSVVYQYFYHKCSQRNKVNHNCASMKNIVMSRRIPLTVDPSSGLHQKLKDMDTMYEIYFQVLVNDRNSW